MYKILVVIIFSFLFSSCSDDPTVYMVKNGKLESCPDKTLGEMVDGFMGSPYWSSATTEEGQKFVNIEGDITYDGKKIEALIQFFVNDETFKFNALEFNEIPQMNLMAMGLLQKMCE